MLAATRSIKEPKSAENQSLIDELNGAVASGGDGQRRRILERIADLFAAGSRGYSSEQIALFDECSSETRGRYRSKGAGETCQSAGTHRPRASKTDPLACL